MIKIFCQRCGSILLPQKKGRKTVLACSCGYKQKNNSSITIKEEVKEQKIDKIEVIDKKVETLPKTKEECPKCKHHEAYYWLTQTRSADEAATRFFKCTKCNHTWRQ
ncbi:MAG: transcription factor S, partial [Nanoarchaeota archaeon]